MTFYFIHSGYYDKEISDGIYEFHVIIPIGAVTLYKPNRIVRLETIKKFIKKRVYIDGVEDIKTASGYCIKLKSKIKPLDQTQIF